MCTEHRTNLKLRDAHPDAKRLGLVGASNYAAVVVGENDNGLPFQHRAKEPLTGGIGLLRVRE
jgi:hypothetical protein